MLFILVNRLGYPSDHTEVKVVDDNNRVVPVNVAGHLCTRGYTTMLGYWNDEAKTKETITADRWLLTGYKSYTFIRISLWRFLKIFKNLIFGW